MNIPYLITFPCPGEALRDIELIALWGVSTVGSEVSQIALAELAQRVKQLADERDADDVEAIEEAVKNAVKWWCRIIEFQEIIEGERTYHDE